MVNALNANTAGSLKQVRSAPVDYCLFEKLRYCSTPKKKQKKKLLRGVLFSVTLQTIQTDKSAGKDEVSVSSSRTV